MAIDVPIVNYHTKGKKVNESTKTEMDALSDAWSAKRTGRSYAGKNITVADIFNESGK